MKKILLIMSTLILFMSCTTTSNKHSRPVWIDTFPAGDEYYVGIGTSNTGNESDDRKIAEDRARTNVAASISTKLHSETEIRTSEDSSGNSFDYVSEEITAVVEQSLKGVDTVDTYYSEQSGAWVYMKLSKALWLQIQKEEMEALVLRISKFIVPSIENFDIPLSTKIQDLLKAKKMILKTPYVGMLKTSILEQSGSLIDILDIYLKEYIDSMTFSITPKLSEVEMGKSTNVTIGISSKKSSSVGNFPYKIVNEKGESVYSGISDKRGFSSTEIRSSKLIIGENYISLIIDRDEIGMDSSLDFISYPKETVIIDVQTISIGLRIEVQPDGTKLTGIDGAIKSLFSSNNLPFKLGDVDSIYIQFDINISDFPKLSSSAPDMAKANAVISLVRDNKTIYSFESKTFKDGGLNPEQAHNRVSSKLIKELKNNLEYVDGITASLSIN